MSGLEEELAALSGGPVFKMVFEGYGDHTAPGAGESMFWDVWVLYAREGVDRAEVIELYNQALDVVPAYATSFVHRALQDLSTEEKASEGGAGGSDAATGLEPVTSELDHGLVTAHGKEHAHDQRVAWARRNGEFDDAAR